MDARANATTPATDDRHDARRRIVAIVGGSSGNLVEWYDFYVYSFTALYFAASFFPRGDQTTQLLNAAGVFAAGFVMRPVGSWLFGRIAEVATHGRRGFYASFQYVTLIGGQLLAVMVLVVLQQLLDDGELRAWGWRIPFAIGAVAAVVAFFLRRSLVETTSREVRGREEAGTLRGVLGHARVPDRAGLHRRPLAVVLHVHHLHAEVPGERERHERALAAAAVAMPETRREGHMIRDEVRLAEG